MSSNRMQKRVAFGLGASFLIFLFFQNCSPVHFEEVPQPPPGSDNADLSSLSGDCRFNGQEIAEGESVTAFQNSSVPVGQTCVLETRTCQDSVLSGSYSYAACAVGIASSCLFDGITIASGSTITAYLTSTTPVGTQCLSQLRACNNGALSGSYTFDHCAPGADASCLFNGQTVTSGQSVPAFPASTVPFGQTCTMQVRTCTNGTLSGTAPFANCNVDAPADCLWNGQSIANGESVTAYQAATANPCASETRTCNNGVLSGSFGFNSCHIPASCALPWGGQIPSGASVAAYLDCTTAAIVRTCSDGSLTGDSTYVHQICTDSCGSGGYYYTNCTCTCN